MFACQRVAKGEDGSNLAIWAPPFFCSDPGREHTVRLFYFRCSWLNGRDLSIILKNGEFSVFFFRHIISADSPRNSPFAQCRGHEDFQSHNRLQRRNLREHPLFRVRILWEMVVKHCLFRTTITMFLNWHAKAYNKSSRFGFDDKCTTIFNLKTPLQASLCNLVIFPIWNMNYGKITENLRKDHRGFSRGYNLRRGIASAKKR